MKVKIARIAGISERDLYSLHIFEPRAKNSAAVLLYSPCLAENMMSV